VQVSVVLIAARGLFGVPFVGGLGVLGLAVFVFVLALVLLGYAISTFARTQMQAMQLTFFFFLPSILLSGFMFPFRGMPGWAQWLGEVFPLTHFIRAIRAVMLKGADLAAIGQQLAVLTVFVAAYAVVALTRYRRTLDRTRRLTPRAAPVARLRRARSAARGG
jgi:ABC-2 type transport system permease protein